MPGPYGPTRTVHCDNWDEGCDAEFEFDVMGYGPTPEGWEIDGDYDDDSGRAVESIHCPDYPDCSTEAKEEALREWQTEHGITPRRVR